MSRSRSRRGWWLFGATVAIALASLAPLAGSIGTTDAGAAASSTVWLCKPGLANNPCASNLDATVEAADGSTHVVQTADAKNPPIDCFYVYPTVSGQQTVNATLHIDPAETGVAVAQAARFSQYCRVYAPMYRQVTLSGLSHDTPAAGAEAYGDVQSAFLDYLKHDNHGRGIVFIGHSQGAGVLIELLKSQVDPKPAVRKLLVSALLMGGNVTVPIGKVVGYDFRHIPACTSASETGCVVAYSSFDQPPPTNSLFGRPGQGVSLLSGQTASAGLQVLCVNPAAPGGGPADLAPYFPTPGGSAAPWVTYPGLYRAQCMSVGGATWLQVTTIATPGDTRPVESQVLGPTWGLHLVDVNIALGNLVSLVGTESKAYVRQHH
ncbi:MAG TPA: DUF3089 domain-containing protein [Acidimicrobiales bacterium]|nr:DUF3089 domain-containing protein [Acidimicrobiales bacterium]